MLGVVITLTRLIIGTKIEHGHPSSLPSATTNRTKRKETNTKIEHGRHWLPLPSVSTLSSCPALITLGWAPSWGILENIEGARFLDHFSVSDL